MSDIVVRAARPQELAKLGELTLAAYRVDGFLDREEGESYAKDLRDAARRHRDGELLVATDGTDEPLGTVTIALPGTPYAELCREGEVEFRMLAVAANARRRGVGEALTRAVIDRAKELGARRVVLCSLTAMRTAHRLYERLGFRRVPQRDWEPAAGIKLLAYAMDL
ncbi:ribosomal protein S18 acetylase RimI-like enzyme [Saccharomonospora amisosensis]|uniref:Ribosomal protein S18 acetylase RimI-like enzyme n=1 Tax=Saccharomonospora amisosensis TaxID=1128677 RepID=A0A7X5UT74_9PSEU|nr:GNAT family N-acetyltransferase [Saccharomonospora amisosensis]NIJ13680.1 ribosomal protein S18 acetylase RimI-like enzyme [Saccharomonospora amisosensis]